MGIPLWLPSIGAKNEQRLWGGGGGGGGETAVRVVGSWWSRGQLVGKGALNMVLEPALQALGVSLGGKFGSLEKTR